MAVDPSSYIAPTARVSPDARIGPGCHIGEFCLIDGDVVIGRDCKLDANVQVRRWTSLGDGNRLSSGVVLGTDPLDRAFDGSRSYLVIGNRNQIREHFTISRATKPEAVTRIGSDNFIMTSGHIAHDCTMGSGVVVASCTLVAGYAVVEDGVFLSGGVVVHQHTRIGRLAMVGGNTRVNVDLPPFFLYSDFHAEPHGLNVVGLRRAGFTREEIHQLKRAYRLLYQSGLGLSAAIARIEAEESSPHTRELTAFLRDAKRGISRPHRATSEREPNLHD